LNSRQLVDPESLSTIIIIRPEETPQLFLLLGFLSHCHPLPVMPYPFFSFTIWVDEQMKCASGAMLLHQIWPIIIIIIIINKPWLAIVSCVCNGIHMAKLWLEEEAAPPPIVVVQHKHFVQCRMKKSWSHAQCMSSKEDVVMIYKRVY